MSKTPCALAMIVSVLGVLAGCAAEPLDESTPDEQAESSADALSTVSAVECNPRADRCDRGEVCAGLSVGRDVKYVCVSGRCDSQRDCGAGYACRLDHCVALERDPFRRPPSRAHVARHLRDGRDDDADRDGARDRWSDIRRAHDARDDRGR